MVDNRKVGISTPARKYIIVYALPVIWKLLSSIRLAIYFICISQNYVLSVALAIHRGLCLILIHVYISAESNNVA